MNRRLTLILFVAFTAFLLLPMTDSGTNLRRSPSAIDNSDITIENGRVELAGSQDEADWWNSTFIYRRYFNFSLEADEVSRTNSPVHLYLTFTEGHCYDDSIRVAYYENPTWTLLPFQVWNTTYDETGTYIVSTRISFFVNVTSGFTETNYYIYYAKEDVGSVSYPDFYPFIYKSYTFSLISLISYYDENNYYIEKYDSSTETWNDPRDIDARWAGTSGSVYTTNEPNGTLSQYEAARYEPDTYSTTLFQGYYAVYANYPLYVHMGQGDEGSNPSINDWFPYVDELGSGTGTKFLIGGVEGFDSRNEGMYWIQAHEDDTSVWVTSVDGVGDTGWIFYNNSAVSSWPAYLDAGEYISKGDHIYTDIRVTNSTKPVSVRAGDDDASHARDIWGFYPSITGALAGEEFYTIDMGNSNDKTRVTNLGSATVDVDWYRNSGSGWVFGGTLSIGANSSSLISAGTASDTNPEDILHIIGESGAMLMVEGVYTPTTSTDGGDWVPTVTGHRYGTDYKLWGINSYKFMIVALENAEVTISGYNGGTLEIPAGGMALFRPVSSSMTLYHINSNASIGVVELGKFSTSSPYAPTGDTGYGWAVPAYSSDQDQAGVSILQGDERHLFEFDITVVDLDDLVVEGAEVTLYNATTSTLWVDEQGRNRTGTTDSNGLVVFEGLQEGTYEVRTNIDAKAWLTSSYSHIWVSNTSNHAITGSVTPIEVVLPMGSFDVALQDLMGNPMAQTVDETTTVRISNDTEPTADGSTRIDQQVTDASGSVSFYRLPKDDYRFFIRYDGNVSSYQYDQMLLFGNWSRNALDFDTGPYSYTFTVPLITLRITVMSWDNLPVEGASIKINNTIDENTYSLTRTSNADGRYSFYRIVNGTWQLDVWKDDSYPVTPTARNNTEVLSDIQGEYSYEVELPISRLNVRVLTGINTFVQGAKVNVTLRDGNLVASGSTNGTGQLSFLFMHANLSSPYFVSYNVTVIAGDASNGFLTEILLKIDKQWWYINNITISVPAYADSYTELNSTLTYLTARWGRNATFTVGYYDRDGPSTTSAISIGASTWVNFTIYQGTTPIGWGYWSLATEFYIDQQTTVNYLIIIDTDFWKLNVSETPYTIVMVAHTNGYDDPETIIVYLTITPAQTILGVSDYSYTEQYGNHSTHEYWIYDTTNSVNVTGLNVYSYVVKLGALELRTGALGVNGHLYQVLPSVLNGLDTGVYSITLTLQKRNYVNQTLAVGVTIIDIPMQVTFVTTGDYYWDPATTSFEFEYGFAGNATVPTLSGVQVIIQWYTETGISYLNVTRSLSTSGGVLTYTFSKNIVPVGAWNISVLCDKANYGLATATFSDSLDFVEVLAAPTTLAAVSSDALTVDWLSPAVFEIDFNRVSDSVGLTGATFSHNWTDSVAVLELGGGIYRITVSTTVEASTFILRLEMIKSNHENGIIDLTITVKVPLLIGSEFGSIENPLEVYWTRNFTIEITLWDQSRINTVVEGATVSYRWFVESVIDEDGQLNGYPGGIYNISLNAYDAVPLEQLYEIVITATLAGGTTDQITIFVRIEAVPNEIVLDQQYFEAFYADVFTVRFYWNNTLDNLPITYADSETYDLIPLNIPITDALNEGGGWYRITVDTRLLGMNANVQGSVYVINIEMIRSGFQDHKLTTVIILVRETDASLVIEPIGRVNWSDYIEITARLYDALHGDLIWLGATITVSYGIYSIQMNNNLDGTFTLDNNDLLSSAWFSAAATPYTLTFTYTLPNFVDSLNTTLVTIDPIPGSIIIDSPDDLEWTWSQEFELQVRVFNTYGGGLLSIEYASVYYLWQGYSITGYLTYSPTSVDYNITIDSSEVPAGQRILLVIVANENYTIPNGVLELNILPVNVLLESDNDEYIVVYGETGEIRLTLSIDDTSVELTSLPTTATISMVYGEQLFQASYQSGTQQYRLSFNPAVIGVENVPGVFVLNITCHLQNYTTVTINPVLKLIAITQVRTATGGFTIEEGQTGLIWFQFLDIVDGRQLSVTPSMVTRIELTINSALTLSLNDGILYDSENQRYYASVLSGQIGERSTTAYNLALIIEAHLYENITANNTVFIPVIISEATVDILGPVDFLTSLFGVHLGSFRIPLSLFQTILLMISLFVIASSSYVGIKRYRIPFAIKQINKALKAMASDKSAKIDPVKTMGGVISELLAPGLAELDLAAPVIEAGPDADYAVSVEDTEDLLSDLDLGLDDEFEHDASGAAGTSEFETELEAELDTLIEEEVAEPEKVEDAEALDIDESPKEFATEEPELEVVDVLESDVSEAEDVIEDISQPEIEEVEEFKEDLDDDISESIETDESETIEDSDKEDHEETEVTEVEESSEDTVEEVIEESIEEQPSEPDEIRSEEDEDFNEMDSSEDVGSEEPSKESSDDVDYEAKVTIEDLEIVGAKLLEMGLSEEEVNEILAGAKNMTMAELMEVLDRIEDDTE